MRTFKISFEPKILVASWLIALPLAAWAQPGWQRTTDYPLSGYQFDPVEAGGRIYVAGGLTGGPGGTAVSSVFFSQATDAGALGAWMATTSLPGPDAGPGAAVWNGWLYVALGAGGIYGAPILESGGVGSWTLKAAIDPAISYRGALGAYKGHLYLFGRDDGSYHNVVRIAAINADGSVGPFSAGSLPLAVAHGSIEFYNDRAYLAGGNTAAIGVIGFTYSAPVRTNGLLGTWRQEADLPVPLWQHSSVITNEQVFLFGGLTNTAAGSQASRIYQGGISAVDGSISNWTAVDTMPSANNTAPGAVYVPSNQNVYLIGGLDAAAGVSTAQVWRKNLGPIMATNHPPVGRISVGPLAKLPGVSGPDIIAPNNTAATVILDGSQSTDADGDPLEYVWQEGGSIIGAGVVVSATLAPGPHTLTLLVSDGTDTESVGVTVQVITPADAVGLVQAYLVGLGLAGEKSDPLGASLGAAAASFQRSSVSSAVNQLRAFENKVRAQIAPIDPALAQELTDAAEQIIGAVTVPAL